MLNEFSHNGKTYCLKTHMDSDYSEDDAIKFNRLHDVQSFFKAAMNNSGAWAIIMSIAKWNYPFSCRPPKRCPEPTDQEFFDAFCQQLYSGELTLIGKTMDIDFKGTLWNLKLKQCCLDTIKDINSRIVLSNTLSTVLVVLPVFKAFFYPPRYSNWASLTSTAYSIFTEDWELLVKDVQIVPQILRKAVRNEAQLHAYDHEKKNEYQLKMFWEGIVHAFE